MLIIYSTLRLERVSMSIRGHLLGAQVGDLQEAIVRKGHDQTVSVLKCGASYKDWCQLSSGGPNKSDVLIDEQEIVEGAKHSHKAGRFEHHLSILSLIHYIALRSLIIFKNVGTHGV